MRRCPRQPSLTALPPTPLSAGLPALQLWFFDGWDEGGNGGIYHEGAPDCMWGRQWAFWKGEVSAREGGSRACWPALPALPLAAHRRPPSQPLVPPPSLSSPLLSAGAPHDCGRVRGLAARLPHGWPAL